MFEFDHISSKGSVAVRFECKKPPADAPILPGEAHGRRMPESYLPLVRMAGILSLMGSDEEAREAGRKAVALHPDISLKTYAASQPYKDSAHLETWIEALRKAGPPE